MRETVAGIVVDAARLRDEIRIKYVDVAKHPDATFHFHTRLRAAANAGYLDGWLEGLPKSSIASFAGVANPFHWSLPGPGESVVTLAQEPAWMPRSGQRCRRRWTCRRRRYDARDARARPG